MKVRFFQNPDGSVRILRPNLRWKDPNETDDEFVVRMGADAVIKDPSLSGLPFSDVDETDIPTDRIDRYKWRIRMLAGRPVCQVDNAVPDKPHPKQALIDRANIANTVVELRQIVLDLIRGA